jgi:hypothetical protein
VHHEDFYEITADDRHAIRVQQLGSSQEVVDGERDLHERMPPSATAVRLVSGHGRIRSTASARSSRSGSVKWRPMTWRPIGNSSTKPFDGTTSNLELAQAIASRLAACDFMDLDVTRSSKTAEAFSAEIEKLLLRRQPEMDIKVEVTDQIAAKVAAGMGRVRVRKAARFNELELRSLWTHEIESHCLTAHNGASHEQCDFLVSAGPRTTLLQEGLAVLSPMQREVFLLRVEQGLDYKAVAVVLATTEGAARVHYHHAVKRLRGRLQ